MNGRYVSLSTGIWSDEDLDGWGAEALLLYVYLIGNDHVHGVSGIGQVSRRLMCAETRLSLEQMADAIRQIGDRVWWGDRGWYWVRKRVAHTCTRRDGCVSPKHAAAVRTFMGCVPEALRAMISDTYGVLIGYRYPIDGVSMGYPVLPTESESESESDELSLAEAHLRSEYRRAGINGAALRVVREMMGMGQGARALGILRYGQRQRKAGRARDVPAFVSKILLGDRSINDDGCLDAAKREWAAWEGRRNEM